MKGFFIVLGFWLFVASRLWALDNYTVTDDLTGQPLDTEGAIGSYTDGAGTVHDPAYRSRQFKFLVPIQVHSSNLLPGTYSKLRWTVQSDAGVHVKAEGTDAVVQFANQSTIYQTMMGPLMRGMAPTADMTMYFGGTVTMLLELVDNAETTVHDSVTVTWEPSGNGNLTTNGPAYQVWVYGMMNGQQIVYPSENNTEFINLYGGSVPANRPGADAPALVDVDLAGWVVENFSGEDCSIFLETIDDFPLVELTPIPAGQTSAYGIIQAPPGAQIRWDRAEAVDLDPPMLVSHLSGTQTYTVPAQGGTWTGSWSITPEGENVDYAVRLNISNAQSLGGILSVTYSGVEALQVSLGGLAEGQQQKVVDVTLSLPAPLGLGFFAAPPLVAQVLNGPSKLRAEGINVYDIAVYEGGEAFNIASQITTQTTDEDGINHQGATYERDLGDGSSIYWSTGISGYSPGETISPTSTANSGLGAVGGSPGGSGTTAATAEEDEARNDATLKTQQFQQDFDAYKDGIEGEGFAGQIEGFLTNPLEGQLSNPNVFTVVLPDWLGLDVPDLTIQLDEPPVTTMRQFMLVALSVGGLVGVVRILKV